ncbi:hypothetical protein GWN63_01595 [Candidatus Bathyarchaeota archaeon]|nr:hypothetical protein [Candidatus Bathyarchaeota archaeon]NIU80930.1 hypothetical protein [Candidatus Bathyarchaeota archaeon]NIV67586.1 hypothetical protein [Candidatus Bathyarchaeota archaeon]NIW16109.1 hypothetical protein [Candidatus Bathyarchaeota archaeon]NIW34215.1 hypothetical protein [Candidatus Bathyarchaeota archaeon]
MSRGSRRSLRPAVSGKRYVVITKTGIRFAKECYSSSEESPETDTELYGFLLRLLSFGGVLPLAIVKRWRRTKILRKASEKKFVVVSGSPRGLPKKLVKAAMKMIWGEPPKSIYS